MANIKFSQFTVGNTESDIDFVVGYKGANNIQISPTNLLAASLSGYLPLTGGTMTGNILFNDNVQAQFGTGADLQIYHDGSNSTIDNLSGHLFIKNSKVDRDIIFQADDGTGVATTTYFRLDGGLATGSRVYTVFPDNSTATFGNGYDFQIYNDGSNSYLQQGGTGGDLYIQQNVNDKDIIFQSDDGSGGVATYFYLDGSITETRFSKATRHSDNIISKFGDGNDLQIYHDGSNSNYITSTTSDIYLRNEGNNDRIFIQATYSGTISNYLIIDGSTELVKFAHNSKHQDSVKALFGDSSDLEIYHNATDSVVDNFAGDLYISNKADDKDIVFRCDDGSGGFTTYFFLDGSTASGGSLYTQFPDNSNLTFGAGNDLRIYHNGTNSNIENFNGSLQFVQNLNDGDINFLCDNGSGGVAEYFRLDGSSARTLFSKNTQYVDNSKAIFGNGDDLEIWHDGTDSIIQNDTGDLEIQNRQNDGDIVFKSDDGSGGVTEYFRLDGNLGYSVASKDIRLQDNVNIGMGSSGDYAQFHDGTNTYLSNGTGDFYIRNQADDKDIIFQADNGSGGNATYLFLDGQNTRTEFLKDVKFPDNVKANFGTSVDLQIYHDGSNSYIDETGTGNLRIRSTNTLELLNAAGSKYYASFTDGGSSKLFHNGSEKLETTSTGIKISGVSEYADNTAAIAGGLTTGDVYRTGDLLKIVH
jgi:hypothetical protein